MSGIFGVVSNGDCVRDLFYGTDYHSHLGTKRGGLATLDRGSYRRFIHNISNAQFRSKFEEDVGKLKGASGIGVISDHEDQPLIVRSHLGTFGLVTVGRVANAADLARRVFSRLGMHFAEMGGGDINQTELIASLIVEGASFEEGIALAQTAIEGSCTLLLLTTKGIYAARDGLGRTPLVLGRKEGALAATIETCAFPNLGYEVEQELGPGEVVLLTGDEVVPIRPPGEEMQICTFLWIYYGYPASSYEGHSVELVRYRCGAALGRRDEAEVDVVAGIPDSGLAHAIGYATERGLPYARPYVKYTPTWPRSFMPQDQGQRDLVAKMKLIPIPELIRGKRVLFCEDSIVRGTQLQDTIERLFAVGAAEVHIRPSCPPLLYSCPFLNFSQSRSELDLAGRRAIHELEGNARPDLADYANPDSDAHQRMLDGISKRLRLTSLRYQRLDDMVEAVGLPKERLCTACWDGVCKMAPSREVAAL